MALFRALGSEEYKVSDIQLSAHLRASLSIDILSIMESCAIAQTIADNARIVVPLNEDVKYRILFEAHGTFLSGHLGQEMTCGSVSQHY